MNNQTTTNAIVDPFVISYNENSKRDYEIFRNSGIDLQNTKPMQYPYSDEYDYRIEQEIIDMDKECQHDLETNNGFRITARQNVNTNLKAIDGIYSSLYGQGLQDESPYIERTRCKCGKTMGKLNNRTICPYCHTVVKFRGDNFEFFGWVILDNFCYIHPMLFNHIQNLIGEEELDKIITYTEELDQDGNLIQKEFTSKEESFRGIGMSAFKDRFDEIISYYANKKKTKLPIYEFIMKHREKVFAHCIPVYTLLLRPIKIKDGHLCFEGTNQDYNMVATEATILNTKKTIKKKRQETLLYNIQTKFMNVIKTIDLILAGKKGAIRGLFGGNYNFISRCVIIPETQLLFDDDGSPLVPNVNDSPVDRVALPYACIMEMLKEVIINVIQKTYNISYLDAYIRWYDALLKVDPIVVSIIKTLIYKHPSGRGIPVIINRNPTIRYGSIMQMYCTRVYVDSYAMGLPLQVLTPLNADFDGDVINILWIINKEFLKDAERVFNPRNAMMIDRNDGYMASDMCHSRDTMLNVNNISLLAKDSYTKEEIMNLKRLIKR